MSILLTHGYFIAEDETEKEIMMPYPPLGLLYLSAYLDLKKTEHEVLDTTFLTEKEWIDYLEKKEFKIIAFYCNFLTKPKILKLIKVLRSKVRYKDVKFALGGPDVTYNIEEYLKHGVDYIILGEGEESFSEFTDQFFDKKEFHKVAGLAYINKEGKLKINKPGPLIVDPDTIPFPNRSKINIKKYIDVWGKKHGRSSLNISTQRGCPYTCQWCSKSVYGQTYRRRSPKSVVDEIETLIKDYKPDSLWFVDDVFTQKSNWIISFAEEMQKRNIKIPFECISRAEKLNENILKLLKNIGCFRIWIGAESGSQRIIDLMQRQVDIQTVIEMMQLTKKHGIEAGTFIMIGYPDETKEDIADTIKYLKTVNPDQFTITKTYPIKGTGLYKQIENDIIYKPDWEIGTDRQTIFKRTYSEKYYDLAVKRITNEVYFNKQKLKGNLFSLKSAKYKVKSILINFLMALKQ